MTFTILLLIIITLVATYFQLSRELHIPGPAFAGQVETFTNQKESIPNPNPDGTGKSFRTGPANTDASYKLLADSIRPTNKTGLTTIGSESCYNTNYQSKIELVGNLVQRTNNYRHQYPDTCSGTRQEMILGFYEPMPLV